MKVTVEKWTSSRKKKEVHFYLDKNKETYLCGFNSSLIDKKTIQDIVKLLKKKVK